MNVDIKSISGDTLLSTPINRGAKGYFSLMQHDYIVLPFSLRTPVNFGIGSYVDLRGVFDDALGGKLAKMYYVTELQNPTYNTSTGGYEYQLRLNAYYWLWNNFIFKYTPESAGGEASWSLTAPLDVQMGVFLRNLSELGFTYNGTPYEISIDSTVENKAVAMTYDNMHLLDALFSMGGKDAWDCDVWVTENVIHFGRCEHGDAVKIELGVEASDMVRNESKGTFATRIYAFGSTRNILANYRPSNEQAVVNGVVQKRLMLPEDTPYVDAYPDMKPFEVVETVVVFDNVYPRRVGTLSDVRTVDRKLTGEEEEESSTFKAYQYKDTGLLFKDEYIIEGQELKIRFQSGKLNGLEFGVIFEPEGTEEDSQTWEIVANEDYGRLLPDETMCPENGDKYILSGFNIQLVSNRYIPETEQELLEKARDYAEKTKVDDGTYTTTLRWSWVKEDQISRTFDVGQKINLVNKGFFGTEGRVSRVIGWEMCLDIPYDNPIYTIGESAQYSRIGEIEDKVESLTYKGQTYTGTGGSGVYVIRTNDSTPASDTNVFSALRSLAVFLRKDKEDSTLYLVKLLGGIITNNIESEGFTTGALGTGFLIKRDPQTGKSYIEVDELFVRMKAFFTELEIKKLSYAGGNFIFSPAGITLSRVETVTGDSGKAYRCYFTNDDGSTATENLFRVDDLVMCQTFNIKAGKYENVSNKRYWRAVVADGDSVVVLGNHSDTSRQNALVISVYGEGSPSLTQHSGIHTYSLDGTEKIRISPNGNLFTGEFRVSTGQTVEDYIDNSIKDLDFHTVKNLLLNSRLDNLDRWQLNYASAIVEFDGYKCLKIAGVGMGIYTDPTTGNARLIPTEGKITNSIDVYSTIECDIKLGCEGIENTIHISETNKWVRVSNTQELDGEKHSYVIYGGSNSGAASLYVKEAKCEEGTASTPWEPSRTTSW